MRDLRKNKSKVKSIYSYTNMFMCCRNVLGDGFIPCDDCKSRGTCINNKFCSFCGLKLIISDGRRGSIKRELLDKDQISDSIKDLCVYDLNRK